MAIQDTAKDILDKSTEVISNLASSAGDFANKTKIRVKIGNLTAEENRLLLELAQEAYEHDQFYKDFREKHASTFEKIDEIEGHKEALEAELAKYGDAVDGKPIAVESTTEPAVDADDDARKEDAE